jgi:hypothetical protein
VGAGSSVAVGGSGVLVGADVLVAVAGAAVLVAAASTVPPPDAFVALAAGDAEPLALAVGVELLLLPPPQAISDRAITANSEPARSLKKRRPQITRWEAR